MMSKSIGDITQVEWAFDRGKLLEGFCHQYPAHLFTSCFLPIPPQVQKQ